MSQKKANKVIFLYPYKKIMKLILLNWNSSQSENNISDYINQKIIYWKNCNYSFIIIYNYT